jgi:hypothetical protein
LPKDRIPPTSLTFTALDITQSLPLPSEPHTSTLGTGTPVRLYAVAWPLANGPGAIGIWQDFGVGISTRLAASLLPAAEKGEVSIVWQGGADGVQNGEVPGWEGLPLGEGHAGLRRRVAELVNHGAGAAEDEGKGKVGEEDVWLYPTGMAAVWRLHRALLGVRGREGKVVVIGSVFHNSFHLFEESEGGFKHFGQADGESGVMEELEKWLEGEREAGRKVAYVFVEFPSNPILVSADLRRLKEVVSSLLYSRGRRWMLTMAGRQILDPRCGRRDDRLVLQCRCVPRGGRHRHLSHQVRQRLCQCRPLFSPPVAIRHLF